MSHGTSRSARPSASAQRGQIILITLFLFALAMSVSLFGFVSTRNPAIDDDAQTQRALAQARDALIGYAATNGTRPGNLPCPDRTGTGSASTCGSVARRIGFLPWRTLGLPELRDGSGAPLLYAVSNTFRANTGVLNADTAGDYTVTGQQSGTGVIAIVFAPGQVVGSQRRDTATATCSTTGTTLAHNLCVANYLEGGNEDGNTSFVTAATSSSFNDQLMLITRDNLFPSVMVRVARTMKDALNTFYTNRSHYPYASAFSDGSYGCSLGTLQGKVAIDSTNCPTVYNEAVLPNWFLNNNWHQSMFYAVSPLCVSAATASSCAATGGLTVSGVSTTARALLVISGRAFSGQARPCTALAHCLEDSENQNGDTVFQSPVLSASNNDRLVLVAP
jgi:hypothetical protein